MPNFWETQAFREKYKRPAGQAFWNDVLRNNAKGVTEVRPTSAAPSAVPTSQGHPRPNTTAPAANPSAQPATAMTERPQDRPAGTPDHKAAGRRKAFYDDGISRADQSFIQTRAETKPGQSPTLRLPNPGEGTGVSVVSDVAPDSWGEKLFGVLNMGAEIPKGIAGADPTGVLPWIGKWFPLAGSVVRGLYRTAQANSPLLGTKGFILDTLAARGMLSPDALAELVSTKDEQARRREEVDYSWRRVSDIWGKIWGDHVPLVDAVGAAVTGKPIETDNPAFDNDNYHRWYLLTDAERRKIQGESTDLRREAYGLLDQPFDKDNLDEARKLIAQAQHNDLGASTFYDPTWSYTFAVNPKMKADFQAALVEAEMQKGAPLEYWEIYRIKDNFTDIWEEIPGEMFVDLWNLLPIEKVADMVLRPLRGKWSKALIETGAKEGKPALELIGKALSENGFKSGIMTAFGQMVEPLPVVGDLSKWLAQQATRSTGERVYANVVDVVKRIGKGFTSDEFREFMGRAQAGTLENARLGARETEILEKMRDLIPEPGAWSDIVDGAIKHLRDHLRGEFQAAVQRLPEIRAIADEIARNDAIDRLTDKKVEEVVAKPSNLVRQIASEFKNYYLQSHRVPGTDLLDDNLMVVIAKKLGVFDKYKRGIAAIDRFSNQLTRTWMNALLPGRPAWVANNMTDSTFRYLLSGGRLFDDMGTILNSAFEKAEALDFLLPADLTETMLRRDLKEPEQVAEKLLRGERYPLGPISFIQNEWNRLRPPSEAARARGMVGYLEEAFQKGRHLLEDLAENPGDLPRLTKEGAAGSVKGVRDLWRAWTGGWTDFNAAVEFTLRARLYHTMLNDYYGQMETRVLPEVLEAIGGNRRLMPIAMSLWQEAGKDPEKLRLLLREFLGKATKDAPYEFTRLVPPDLGQRIVALTAEDRAAFSQHVLGALREARTNGPLTEDIVNTVFGDIGRQIDEMLVQTSQRLEDQAPKLTDEAEALLRKVDEGGVPAMITNNLRRIASENGVTITDSMTPADVVAALRAKVVETVEQVVPTYAGDLRSPMQAALNLKDRAGQLRREVVESFRDAIRPVAAFREGVVGGDGLRVTVENGRAVITLDPKVFKGLNREATRTRLLAATTDLALRLAEDVGAEPNDAARYLSAWIADPKLLAESHPEAASAFRRVMSENPALRATLEGLLGQPINYETAAGSFLHEPHDLTAFVNSIEESLPQVRSEATRLAAKQQAAARATADRQAAKLASEGTITPAAQLQFNSAMRDMDHLQDRLHKWLLKIWPGPLAKTGDIRASAWDTYEEMIARNYGAVGDWTDDALQELNATGTVKPVSIEEMLRRSGINIIWDDSGHIKTVKITRAAGVPDTYNSGGRVVQALEAFMLEPEFKNFLPPELRTQDLFAKGMREVEDLAAARSAAVHAPIRPVAEPIVTGQAPVSARKVATTYRGTVQREQFWAWAKKAFGLNNSEVEASQRIIDSLANAFNTRTGEDWYQKTFAGYNLVGETDDIPEAALAQMRELIVGGTTPAGAEDILFSTRNPGWYLRSQQIIESKMKSMKTMPAEQVARFLQGEVTKEEMHWLELDDFLAERAGETVTRDELLSWIQQHEPEVQEVLIGNKRGERTFFGGPNPRVGRYEEPGGENYRELLLTWKRPVQPEVAAFEEVQRRYDNFNGRMLLKYPDEGMSWSLDDIRAQQQLLEERDAAHQAMELATVENRLPNADVEAGKFHGQGIGNKNPIVVHMRFNERAGENGERVLFIEEIQSDLHQHGRDYGYLTPEFLTKRDELKENIVKAAQTQRDVARKHGITLNDAMDYYDDPIAFSSAHGWMNLIDNPRALLEDSRDVLAEFVAADKARMDAELALNAFLSKAEFLAPEAPWQETYNQLAFRRMVRWAAEHDFDRIAWTTGQQQADRYSLQSEIDTLNWYLKPGIGKFTGNIQSSMARDLHDARLPDELKWYLEGHRPSTKIELSGTQAGEDAFTQTVKLAELDSYVGREIGNKIRADIAAQKPEGIINQEGLKVGGQGMSEVYDKKLLGYAQRFGSKFNAPAEMARVGFRYDEPVVQYILNLPDLEQIKTLGGYLQADQAAADRIWAERIRPGMVEAGVGPDAIRRATTQVINNGWSADDIVGHLSPEIKAAAVEYDNIFTRILDWRKRLEREVESRTLQPDLTFATEAEAREALNKLIDKDGLVYGEGLGQRLYRSSPDLIQSFAEPAPLRYLSQPSLPINNAMRESARDGMSLFNNRGVTTAAVQFMDDGRAILHAVQGQADVASLLHEVGHILRRQLDAPDQQAVEAWIGKPFTEWGRDEEEQFAKAFEKYLADGVAPTNLLERAFQTLRSVLINIYNSLNGYFNGVEISPQLRQVFDQYVGQGVMTPEQIEAWLPGKTLQLLRNSPDPLVREAFNDEFRWLIHEISAVGLDGDFKSDLIKEQPWWGGILAGAPDMEHPRATLTRLLEDEIAGRATTNPELAELRNRIYEHAAQQLSNGTDFIQPNPYILEKLGLPDEAARTAAWWKDVNGISDVGKWLTDKRTRRLGEEQDRAWQAFINAPRYGNRSLLDVWGGVADSQTEFRAYLRDYMQKLRDRYPGRADDLIDSLRQLDQEIESFGHQVVQANQHLLPDELAAREADLARLYPVAIPHWQLPDDMRTWLSRTQETAATANAVREVMDYWRTWLVDQVRNGDKVAADITDAERADLSLWGEKAIKAKHDILNTAMYGGELKGRLWDGAIPTVNKNMLDYEDFTRFDELMKTVIPFWMFPSRSLPFWAEYMVGHPWLPAAYAKLLRNSQRAAYQQDATTSDGRQLPSLEGYLPLPGTNVWFNPAASLSFRYALPRLSQQYNEQDESTTPTQQIYEYLRDMGQTFGFSLPPWVTLPLTALGVQDANRIPGWSLIPQVDLIPPWVERDVLEKIDRSVFPNASAIWNKYISPEPSWKDYLVERQLLWNQLAAMSDPAMSSDRKLQLALEAQTALLKREGNDLYDKTQREVEASDYWQRVQGYFTGVFPREWSDAAQNFNSTRDEINTLRDAINNQVQAAVFKLDPDAGARYQHYLDRRYKTPEGYLTTLYGTIRFTQAPNGEPLYGEDRREQVAQNIHEDQATQAYYDAVGNLRSQLDAKLAQLPVGADSTLTRSVWDWYFAERNKIEDSDLYADARRAWVQGYKPTEMVEDHYRDLWFQLISETRPEWDRAGGETFSAYQQKLAQWQADIPAHAAALRQQFSEKAQREATSPEDLQRTLGVVKKLQGETTYDDYTAWQKHNDTVYDALNAAWKELYWNPYWAAVEGKDGYERLLAEQQFKAAHPTAPTPEALSAWVQSHYEPGQFSNTDLLSAARAHGVESIDQRLAPEDASGALKDQAYDLLSWAGPGQGHNDLVDEYIRLGGERSDIDIFYSTGGAWKDPARLEAFVTRLTQAARNLKLTQPNASEVAQWIVVQDLNDRLHDEQARKFGDDIFALVARYFDSSSAEKKLFSQDERDRIDGYLDFRTQWGEIYPEWAAYYLDSDSTATKKKTGGSAYGLFGGSGGSSGGAKRKSGGGGRGGGSKSVSYTTLNRMATAGFIPQGLRSFFDSRDLLNARNLGKGGYGGDPYWPPELWTKWGPPPNGLPQSLPTTLVQDLLAGQTDGLGTQVLKNLGDRNPEWKDYLTGVLADVGGGRGRAR